MTYQIFLAFRFFLVFSDVEKGTQENPDSDICGNDLYVVCSLIVLRVGLMQNSYTAGDSFGTDL